MQIYNPIKAVIDFIRKNQLKKVVNDKGALRILIESSIEKCLVFLDTYTESNYYSIRDQALQSILKLALTTYLRDNEVDIDNPNNIGRKSVLFQSKNGIKDNFNFKIKSATNTRFWNKLRKERAIGKNTYFIIVDSYDIDYKKAFLIERSIQSLETQQNIVVKYVFDSFINTEEKDFFRKVIPSRKIDKTKIGTLISEDKIIEAFEVIENQYNYKEITNLKAQLKKSKSDFFNGIKSLEDHNIEKNRIRSALLEMID